MAGGPLRAWSTACQRPGAKRSRRRPAFFAGRGLTGRGPARTLFPLRNGSFPIAGKSTADGLSVRFVSGSRTACDCRIPFTVSKTAYCRDRIPSQTLLGVCRENSGSRLSPPRHRRRTKPRCTPNSSTGAGNGLDPHQHATLDRSIRLREERLAAPGGNPLVPAVPQLLCFLW